MTELLTQVGEFCAWAPAHFLIISENVFDPLIYYSHIVPVLFSLPLAFIILFSDFRSRLNQYFFATVFFFSLWSFSDLVLWASPDPGLIMFFWSLVNLMEPFIYASALLFAYTLLYRDTVPTYLLVLMFALVAPVVILLPTTLEIETFNLTNCWREVTEGPLVFYSYIIEIVVTLLIIFFTILYFKNTTDISEARRRNFLGIIGTLMFLGIFSSGNIIGSINEDWSVAPQYGLFGMPIMVAFLAFLIAKYRMFKAQIMTAEFLIGSLGILIVGILFVQSLEKVRLIGAFTFVLTILLGAILIRSIRREIQQKKQIEELAGNLQKANDRLKILDKMKSEFVSIASHQLRSPLTAIRGYASMLAEGSYGKIPAKALEAVNNIADSSKYMAMSVEDYLNVSRIEAGNMKYELSDFNLKELTERIVDEMRPVALKKGLVMVFRSDCDGSCSVNADVGKTRQVIMNLLDNSMKYTPKGTITVVAHDDPKAKKMYVTIQDTGVGMSKDTLEEVFDKFVRAKNANQVNVTGTGLGLFVAKKMVDEMKGRVWAESEGEGKGATFHLELPLLPGKYVR